MIHSFLMVLGHHWRRSSGPLGLLSSLWCSTAAVSECQHTQGQDGALESSCFAAGEGGWSAFLFIPLTAGPQSSTSCNWTDPAWKDVAGICPKANLSQTHLDAAAALQRPTRRHPVVAASGQPCTALNLVWASCQWKVGRVHAERCCLDLAD